MSFFDGGGMEKEKECVGRRKGVGYVFSSSAVQYVGVGLLV